MRLFRKKKTTTETKPLVMPSACEIFGHNYQDFPWFIVDSYDERRDLQSQIQIFEYYVCHICHEIKKVKLSEYNESLTRSDHDAKVKRLEKEFKDYIKPIPVVKDMIEDMIHVDKEKLAAWERLHASTQEEQKFELKIPGEERN